MALLLADLTAQHPRSDEAVFNALVAAAGVDTIEQVLLHHVHSRRHDRQGHGRQVRPRHAACAQGAGRNADGRRQEPQPAADRAARPGPERSRSVHQAARLRHQPRQRADRPRYRPSSASVGPLSRPLTRMTERPWARGALRPDRPLATPRPKRAAAPQHLGQPHVGGHRRHRSRPTRARTASRLACRARRGMAPVGSPGAHTGGALARGPPRRRRRDPAGLHQRLGASDHSRSPACHGPRLARGYCAPPRCRCPHQPPPPTAPRGRCRSDPDRGIDRSIGRRKSRRAAVGQHRSGPG